MKCLEGFELSERKFKKIVIMKNPQVMLSF